MCSEKRRLEEQIKSVEKQLMQLPDGKLICKRNGKRYKWYHNKDGKQIYIPKKDRNFVEALAAKKYLEHLQEDLVHEKNAIEFYIRHHKESKSDEILTQMPEYQELLKPYFKVSSKILEEWQNSPYDQSMKYPEQLKHKTASGNIVRSKSEVLIDMALYKYRIPFRYECALAIGDEIFYPDFTILHPVTGKLYYWEHFGKMDNQKYASNAIAKLRFYSEHGIALGDQLIITYETLERPLSLEVVENTIKEYFL